MTPQLWAAGISGRIFVIGHRSFAISHFGQEAGERILRDSLILDVSAYAIRNDRRNGFLGIDICILKSIGYTPLKLRPHSI